MADLTEVGVLDPAALAVLVDAHSRFLDAGGTLVLTGVGPPTARLLKRASLDKTLVTIARATDPPPAQTMRGPALDGAPSRDPADQSSTSAAARAVIVQAVGVVMSRRRCSVMEATGSAIFTTAFNDQITTLHPCAGIKAPTVPKAQRRIITPEQFTLIHQALPTPEVRLLVETDIETGLRWGEIVELRVHDLDLAHSQLVCPGLSLRSSRSSTPMGSGS